MGTSYVCLEKTWKEWRCATFLREMIGMCGCSVFNVERGRVYNVKSRLIWACSSDEKRSESRCEIMLVCSLTAQCSGRMQIVFLAQPGIMSLYVASDTSNLVFLFIICYHSMA